ncbi:MAG: AMP-binding protein, partial [Verrucomicrobiales bacterium]|nr:AMP-binding protein [Verrucomicrobiales bacterium]
MKLYERWLGTVERFREEMAVRDVCGRVLTFGELAEAVEGMGRASGAVLVRGGGVVFLIEVLRGWRDGVAVIPVDSGEIEVAEGLPEWVAHVKVTSGSTGAAKVVLFREGQVVADAEAIVATMGLRREWPNVGVISMAHSYGFSNLVTPLFLYGIPLVLAENPLPEAMRRAMAGHEAVTLAAVPAMWRAWRAAG